MLAQLGKETTIIAEYLSSLKEQDNFLLIDEPERCAFAKFN